MRLVSKNLTSRRSQPYVALVNLDKNQNQNHFFEPEQRANQMHFAKRATCPATHIRAQQIGFIQDLNTAAKCSTIVDSINSRYSDLKEKSKILTLAQIKSIREPAIAARTSVSSRVESGRKIFVSISKRNQILESKQRKAEPKLSDIGRQLTLLRALSNKKRIVNTVQMQMHENIQKNIFVCL